MDFPKFAPPGSVGAEGLDVVPYQDVRELMANPPIDPEDGAAAEQAGPDEEALFWKKQIAAALVHERRWRAEAEQAEMLAFGPDIDPGTTGAETEDGKNKITDKIALIHANMEILKPLLYSETPQPIVSRRWRGDGRSDPTALMCAEAGQRLASFIVTTTPFDDVMCAVRDDWLGPGRGMARAIYSATWAEAPVTDPLTGQPAMGEDGQPVMEKVKTFETVKPAHAPWRRLVCAPMSWSSLPWMAFDVPMTRSRVEKRFPEHAAHFSYPQTGLVGSDRAKDDTQQERASIIHEAERSGDMNRSPFDTTTVWEIWDRENRRVIWWSPDCPNYILDRQDDPLELEDFFPGPKPLLATTKGDTLTPRPDIRYYEARAAEIDKASAKIDKLMSALSVSGLIPASMKDDMKKLLDGTNKIVPVEAWAALMQKGGTGAGGVIQWLPLDPIITAIQALVQMREQNKAMMFDASGISDVMRSAGDPTNTATQASLEGKYAGLRLADRQRKIAVFARGLLRILVEMGVELFDTKTLAEICDLDLPMTEAERKQIADEAQAMQAQFQSEVAQFQQIMAIAQQAEQAGQPVDPAQLPPEPVPPKLPKVPETSWELVHDRLRSDIKRKLTITIETKSTIIADETADRDARIEFLSAFASLVQQIMPMMQAGLMDMKTAKELLLFGVRGFAKARTLELMITQLPDEPPASKQEAEDASITVAKIRAETDRMLKEMDLADSEKDRQQELTIAAGKLLHDGQKQGADHEAAREARAEQRIEKETEAAVE